MSRSPADLQTSWMGAQHYPWDSYGGEAPHNDTDTSVAAAAAIERHVSKLASQVLTTLDAVPDGLCNREVQDITGLSNQTETARMRELCLAGLVIDSGRRRIPAGGRRLQIVWRVTK